MIATIEHREESFRVDLNKPIDISIPLRAGDDNPTAWYVPAVQMEPVRMGDWVGEVKQGGSVNFFNIHFNPHGHGTHTECVGHISQEKQSVNQCVKHYFFTAKLISLTPFEEGEDKLLLFKELKAALGAHRPEAVIIRTLPNEEEKLKHQYSNTNPPYLQEEAASYLKEIGVKHLLIDLPSVDREEDGGALLAHHAFWNHPADTRLDCSITELIYVPNTVADGSYLLNLCFAPFENDASPSRPTLYALL
jgi:arylformamidase